ncbi:MAG: DUF805 domain-containing protein [Rhodospirillaceae bacterium]|nr:DUF805 domain-containing protein [Rhodospirillaceae bacterium]
MNMITAIQTCFSKFIAFGGRAMRSEFWYWQLFCFVGSVVAVIFDVAAFPVTGGVFGGLFSLVVVVPSWAVGARRLHDIDKSGWWQLLWLIPLIGPIILIVWFIRPGDHGPNDYGPDPFYPERLADAPFVDG